MSWLLLSAVLAQYTPQEAQAVFAEANAAYYERDAGVAEQKYEKLLAQGQGGPDVLFNLGTACLAQGKLGKAVLYLERARRLSTDDDIEAQLALAKQAQLDRVLGDTGEAPFVQRLAATLDGDLIAAAVLALVWLTFLVWLWWRRGDGGPRVVPALVLAGVALLALAAVGGLAAEVYVSHTVKEAVVMQDTVQAKEFPGEQARTAFEVHAGLTLRVMETQGSYTRIRLPNALEGWVESGALESL